MKLVLGTLAALATFGIIAGAAAERSSAQQQNTISPPAAREPAVLVTLTTPAKTGPTAQAILSQHDADVLVTVKSASTAMDAESVAATIVHGACAQQTAEAPSTNMANGAAQTGDALGDSLKLTPLSKGLSQTSLHGVHLTQLTTGGYAIVVAQKPQLCGDLSTAHPIPGTQEQ